MIFAASPAVAQLALPGAAAPNSAGTVEKVPRPHRTPKAAATYAPPSVASVIGRALQLNGATGLLTSLPSGNIENNHPRRSQTKRSLPPSEREISRHPIGWCCERTESDIGFDLLHAARGAAVISAHVEKALARTARYSMAESLVAPADRLTGSWQRIGP
jgi:hypothetical protein